MQEVGEWHWKGMYGWRGCDGVSPATQRPGKMEGAPTKINISGSARASGVVAVDILQLDLQNIAHTVHE